MKRYDYVVDIDGEFLGMEETPDGIWVKYEDVKEAIDQAWWDATDSETE